MYAAYAAILVSVYHRSNYLERSISNEGDYERHALMERLTLMDNEDCYNQLRMGKDAFARLVNILRGTGRLRNSAHSNVEEQVAKFLHIVGHNLRNRTMKFYFKRSSETVSRHFHQVLRAIISLDDVFLKQPDGLKCPQEIKENTKFWPYFKAHPGASQLRHKPIRNYDKLSILLGKDRATGSLATGAKERQLRWAQEQNLDDTIPLGSSQHGIRDETFPYVENEATTETSFSSADASVSAPKSNKETKKRKAKYADIVSEELRSIRVGMDAVVAALDRSNLQNYTEEQLFEEIAKIGGMSDVSHMKAYQALIGDVSAARAFLACPIDRRKLWLSVKFGPTFFDA
ncbi:hypothetical protein VitviT2T_009985 [Vitis vinifera]|nr:hypothetical protein VitviT2T_009985 [Vitis vinifera]